MCVVVTVKLIMNEINDDVACNEREREVLRFGCYCYCYGEVGESILVWL